MTIDPDEFEVWQNHPVTVAYFARVEAEQERTKLTWMDLAWKAGNLSEREYAYHVSRHDTLEFMRTLGFEDIFQKEDNERSS